MRSAVAKLQRSFDEAVQCLGLQPGGRATDSACVMMIINSLLMHGLASAGCEFQVVEAPLEEPFLGYYRASARMWNQLRREFLYAAEQVLYLILCWCRLTAQLHSNKGHHQMHAAAQPGYLYIALSSD